VPIMLRSEDEHWLRDKYPRLIPGGNGVAGNIAFTATYNNHADRFQILSDGTTDLTGGLALSGDFSLRIQERSHKTFSALPAVYIEGLEPSRERHIGRQDRNEDKSACLCSPFVEHEFLQPEFQFRPFLEQLVIPFLYGQVFYSLRQQWPWPEYAHGAVGLLEAYSKIAGPAKAEYCPGLLRQDNAWGRIEAAFRQKLFIKGHTPCFCPKMDHIRRCHSSAWQGIQKLQRDIRELGIRLPSQG